MQFYELYACFISYALGLEFGQTHHQFRKILCKQLKTFVINIG